MNRVILVTNKNKDADFSVAKKVVKKLSSLGFEIMIDKEFSDLKIENVAFYDELPENAFLIIVIGGDGSIIDRKSVV